MASPRTAKFERFCPLWQVQRKPGHHKLNRMIE